MNRKSARHARVFDYPWCIYCGGVETATTVDHVPARNLFDGRLRPKGLEFPSCRACNEGTKRTELVAALISRAYPDATTPHTQAELTALLSGVGNNAHEVLRELRLSRAKAKLSASRLNMPDAGFLKLDGPLVAAHLEVFAAKFGFAFHFYATGKAVPEGGGVISAMYSNVNMLEGQLPDDFIDHFGSPSTLQQGSKHVGDQFRYAVQATEDRGMTMAFASFRQSLALATFSANDARKLEVRNEIPARLFVPGDLKTPVADPEFIGLHAVIVGPPCSWGNLRFTDPMKVPI